MKKIKVKVQQCGSDAVGFTYRIVQTVNCTGVTVRNKTFLVGDYLELSQLEELCTSRRYEVTVNSTQE